VDVGNAHLVYLSASSGYFPEMMCWSWSQVANHCN
jgi:hypothetical protein